ncbi:MAG: hypothetical protein A2X46_11815 [Lentisphaerae bacterium GWF2_57_35]|nr:MAG: hypothetical protein A2X46_11815 [Lentisphaerae bacterium GWF2_57_35]
MKSAWMGLCLAGLAVATLLIGCSPKATPEKKSATAGAQDESRTATDFIVARLNGDSPTLKLSDYAGNVILLDFWATWCAPCKAELPILNKLYQDWKDRGFLVIGLSVDHGEESAVAEAVKGFDISYPVGLANEDVQKAYGGIRAVPTKFLLDKQGIVRQYYVGVVPEVRLREDIETLLKQSSL